MKLENVITPSNGNTVAVFTRDSESLEIDYAGISITGDWKIKADIKLESVVVYVRPSKSTAGKIIVGKIVDIKDVGNGRKAIHFVVNTLLSTYLNWPEFNGFGSSNPVIYVKSSFELINGGKDE